MTSPKPDILCIGSVLWDVIGRAAAPMRLGADVPGRITRIPGGVAFNIAMTLARQGLRPVLLTSVGQDDDGDSLLRACKALGCEVGHVFRSTDLPTDRYMAIEAANGLIAAIADAHSLEAAGDLILQPLRDGPLGTPQAPYTGMIALDGNLTESLLAQIARDTAFAHADLRVVPASPGKAGRLGAFLRAGRGTLYVNLEEAEILCGAHFASAAQAGAGLVARGALRALVTNGAAACCDATAAGVLTCNPPQVTVQRVTGAGDTFMAAHMAAELGGAAPSMALHRAVEAAAAYVSGAS